jgi:hypothetical protein
VPVMLDGAMPTVRAVDVIVPIVNRMGGHGSNLPTSAGRATAPRRTLRIGSIRAGARSYPRLRVQREPLMSASTRRFHAGHPPAGITETAACVVRPAPPRTPCSASFVMSCVAMQAASAAVEPTPTRAPSATRRHQRRSARFGASVSSAGSGNVRP